MCRTDSYMAESRVASLPKARYGTNRALDLEQEAALIYWITLLNNAHVSPTALMVQQYAN